MLTDEEMYALMHKGWKGGVSHGTKCGMGSVPEHSMNARAALAKWCKKYGIRTVNDAGAGDLAWKRGFEWDVEYRAFDLIPRHESVIRLDITQEVMPDADMILCRATFNHLDEGRVLAALGLFMESARYLAATQYDNGDPEPGGRFWRLDLRRYLGDYIDSVQDLNVPIAKLALWDFA